MRKQIQIVCLAGALLSMTGCSALSGITKGEAALGNSSEIQQQNFAEKQEIMDYYAEGMKYANVTIRKAVAEDEVGYNSIEPNSDTWNKLISNYQKIIVDHSSSEYIMSKGLHNYFKVFADQMVLSESTIKRAKESGGYYYLTVEFKVSPNQQGAFTNRANYLGLDGVIERDYTNQDTINAVYLRTLLNKVNDTKLALQEPLFPNYEDGQVDTVVPETVAVETEAIDDVTVDGEIADGAITETEAENQVTSNTNTESSDMAQLDGDLLVNVRRLPYDIKDITELGGSSQEQISYMPEIELVYNIANTEGEMNGFGIYQEGKAGLTSFGYDSAQDSNKLIATFVFQQNELSPDDMNYSFMFINSFENANPIFSNESFTKNSITVPNFLNTQLGMLIENIDRAINNRDIKSLMDNQLIDDDGLGLRYAVYGASSDIVTFSTSIKRIAQRTDKTYLLELERTVEDSPKNAGSIAQYRDVYYAVVRQDGTEFILNDIALVKRDLTKTPVIEAESATVRRLVALNLSGEVSDNTKLDIQNGVLKNLADYSTNRTVNEDGSIAMYDCFDTDMSLLTEERKEYINSKIRSLLFAKGYEAASTLYIEADEWIGGYDTQVEFTTREFVDYVGSNSGTYVENYYLVSHYGTEWLIDDIITIKEEVLEGDAYTEKVAEFKQ